MKPIFCEASELRAVFHRPHVYNLVAMENIEQHVAPYDLVMRRLVAPDEHVVMLCKEGRYAVCRIYPVRNIATAPNFHVPSGHGLLNAPLSSEGLKELLHWTERAIALDRFVLLLHRVDGGCNPQLSVTA